MVLAGGWLYRTVVLLLRSKRVFHLDGVAAAGGSSLQEDSQGSSGTVLGAAAGSDSSQGEVSSAAPNVQQEQ
jgi:hypothetical protein